MSTLNYPHISTNPAYKAEAEKLAAYNVQYNECQEKLNNLQAERAKKSKQSGTENKALTIEEIEIQLNGGTLLNQIEQIEDTERQLRLLAQAVEAQRTIINNLVQELSQKAGDDVKEQHKAIVKRMIEAVQALHDANLEEYQLRNSLDELGYTKRTVEPLPYFEAHDPTDPNTPAYYWIRDAVPYIQTVAQKEATARKNKIAELIG